MMDNYHYSTDQEYKALYRRILADPFDDLPRLMVADYLDENNNPAAAEFIRVQVSLAALGDTGQSEQKSELILLERSHLVKIQRDGWHPFYYHRGFLSRLHTTPERLTGLWPQAALFPITHCTFMKDNEPYKRGNIYQWYNQPNQTSDSFVHPESDLPAEIFDLLTGSLSREGDWRTYFTLEHAEQDLRDAMFSYLREKCGSKANNRHTSFL